VGFEVVRRVILSWSFFISPSWYIEFFFGIIEAMVSLAALFLGACRRPICDGIGHPANVATCARMTLCPISYKIHNSIQLNSFIYCAKKHFLCFCFKYNEKTCYMYRDSH
jgi:hypothetical protein